MNTPPPLISSNPSITPQSELNAIRAAFRPELYLIPMIIIGYSSLMPREFSFTIGSITMAPTRTAALLLLPFALTLLKSHPLKFSLLDLLAGFVFFWHAASSFAVDGFEIGLTGGFAYALDLSLVYLIMRLGVRNHADLRNFLIVLFPGLLIVGFSISLESITHTPMVRPILGGLVGNPPNFVVTTERLGLMRGSGPFSHPILAGAFLSAFLPLFWGAFGNLPRLRWIAISSSFFAFFTLSSAAGLGLIIGIGVILIVILQRRTFIPLLLLGALALATLLIGLEAATGPGAVGFFSRYMTLSPGSAFYRTVIWEHASIEVANNPIFGIGIRDWERPIWMIHDSVDAYWLLVAMKYGLPASLAMLALIISAAIVAGRSAAFLPMSPARDLNIGVAISIGLTVFIGFTVHFWENMIFMLLFLAACGIGISQATIMRRRSILGDPYPKGRGANRNLMGSGNQLTSMRASRGFE